MQVIILKLPEEIAAYRWFGKQSEFFVNANRFDSSLGTVYAWPGALCRAAGIGGEPVPAAAKYLTDQTDSNEFPGN